MDKIAAIREKISVCVISSGEKTLDRCVKEASKHAKDMGFQFYEVQNVCPRINALRTFLKKCKTEYTIQVDADMILLPRALEMMVEFLYPFLDDGHDLDNPKRSGVYTFDDKVEDALSKWYRVIHTINNRSKFTFACFSLWDEFEERRIPSLKIWHTETSLKYLEEGKDCDDTCAMWRGMDRNGHLILSDFVNKEFFPMLALHGTYYTDLQVFAKYRDWGRKSYYNHQPQARCTENLKFSTQMAHLYKLKGNEQYLLAIFAYWQGVQEDYAVNANLSKNISTELSDPLNVWFASLVESRTTANLAERDANKEFSLIENHIMEIFNSFDEKLDVYEFNERMNFLAGLLRGRQTLIIVLQSLAYSFGLYLYLSQTNETQKDYVAFKLTSFLWKNRTSFEAEQPKMEQAI